MKNLSGIKILIPVLFLILAIRLDAQSNWERLEYHYNSGALPPPYHYAYTITIDIKGNSKMVYSGGHIATGISPAEYSFTLSKKELKKLKSEIKKSEIFDLDIKQRPVAEIPDGGYSDGLEFYGYDSQTDTIKMIKFVPTYPELKYENILNKLYKTIKECVPIDIWNEVNSVKK
jgi:hypothetical protein